MEQAIFNFEGYSFTQATLDFTGADASPLKLEINPSGVFHRTDKRYTLTFDFSAKEEASGRLVVHVACVAQFRLSSEELPDYFYANSIAIVFPYVRAFVSTLSLQANIGTPIVIPTLNLSSLRDRLIADTQID
jgi:preprotein translocase subunit secB